MKDHGELPSGHGPGEEPGVDGSPVPVDAEAEPRLAALLAALSAPGDTNGLPGEQEARAAFRAHVPTTPPTPSRRPRMLAHLTAAKVAAAALSGGLVLTGGAAAATGSLPGAAQQTAKDMLATVGVQVPGPDDAAGTHPDGETGETAGGAGSDTSEGKGEEVSDVATTTEETGRDKGAEIADTASDGKSRVGEQADPEKAGDAAQDHAPEGAGDAGDAGDDASEKGTSTAEDARDGAADTTGDAGSTGGDRADDAAGDARDGASDAGADDQAGR